MTAKPTTPLEAAKLATRLRSEVAQHQLPPAIAQLVDRELATLAEVAPRAVSALGEQHACDDADGARNPATMPSAGGTYGKPAKRAAFCFQCGASTIDTTCQRCRACCTEPAHIVSITVPAPQPTSPLGNGPHEAAVESDDEPLCRHCGKARYQHTEGKHGWYCTPLDDDDQHEYTPTASVSSLCLNCQADIADGDPIEVDCYGCKYLMDVARAYAADTERHRVREAATLAADLERVRAGYEAQLASAHKDLARIGAERDAYRVALCDLLAALKAVDNAFDGDTLDCDAHSIAVERRGAAREAARAALRADAGEPGDDLCASCDGRGCPTCRDSGEPPPAPAVRDAGEPGPYPWCALCSKGADDGIHVPWTPNWHTFKPLVATPPATPAVAPPASEPVAQPPADAPLDRVAALVREWRANNDGYGTRRRAVDALNAIERVLSERAASPAAVQASADPAKDDRCKRCLMPWGAYRHTQHAFDDQHPEAHAFAPAVKS